MAALAARILAAALLEGDDLGAARLLDQLASDRRAGDGWCADFGRRAVDEHQDLLESDDLTGIALELLDRNRIPGSDAVLLAAGLDDCEHRCLPCSTRRGP